jgi:hypothetical protein
LLSNIEVELVRRGLWEYIKKGQFERILYKPHPAKCNQTTPTEFRKRVKIITSPLPVEMLIENLHTNEVISYCSSALLNISDLYPEIRCISVGFNRIAKKYNEKYLLELFQSRKIHLIDI